MRRATAVSGPPRRGRLGPTRLDYLAQCEVCVVNLSLPDDARVRPGRLLRERIGQSGQAAGLARFMHLQTNT